MRSLSCYFILIMLGFLTQNADAQKCKSVELQHTRLKSESNPDTISSLYYQIADFYWHSQADSSMKYLRKYLENAKIDNNPYSEADALYWIADLFYRNNLDSASYFCNKYYQAALELKDTAWIGYAHEFFGYIQIDSGEMELALTNFQKALEYFEIVEDAYQVAACYNNMGYAITFGSDQSIGMNYFIEALKIAEHTQDTSLLSDVCNNIAYFYDKVGDISSAITYYQKSLEFEMAMIDSMDLATTHGHLAYMHAKAGNHEESSSHVAEALACVPERSIPHKYAEFYILLSEYYVFREKAEAALHCAKKVEDILKQIQAPFIRARYSSILGDISLLKGKHAEAVRYYDRSTLQLERHKIYEFTTKVQAKKAEALSSLGLHEEAYDALKLAIAATDSLRYGKVAALLGSFEQEMQQKEALEQDRLEMELSRQVVENENQRIREKLRFAVLAILLLLSLTGSIMYFLATLRKKNSALQSKNNLIDQQKSLLEESIASLKTSEKELKELNSTKDKLFSIVAHDLKNPFNAVIGFSELFLKNKSNLEKADILSIMESMHTSARFGYSLLENLLEWARAQTGSLRANPTELSVLELLNYQIPYFSKLASEKRIRFDVQSPSVPKVFADVNMVNTVLRNLLQNALKFSHMNSVVSIHFSKTKDTLITCIEDQGTGIEEKDLRTLFSVGSSIQLPGTEGETGTGLGLILSKEFIEKNKGKIWVESTHGKGSKFYFSLPLTNEGQVLG